MAAQKWLALVAGRIKEVAAILTSSGAGDSGKVPGLDATGKLDSSFMPVGVAADVKVMPASEALGSGAFVNVYNSAGTLKCRKADASSNAKQAHGFVLAAVLIGADATVYSQGPNTQVSGQTIGANVYLSDTPGEATDTAPTTTGHIVQALGIAMSATEINFEPQDPIELL